MALPTLIIPAFMLVAGVIVYNTFSDGYQLRNMLMDYKNPWKKLDVRDNKEKISIL